MKPGEKFEKLCYEYLKDNFENSKIFFKVEGGMDSTKSDIAVITNYGKIKFYIEVKSSNAQSGQFVLIPNYNTRKFEFSSKNRSIQNEVTDIIIKYMNEYFDRFNDAGTAGKQLNLDSSVFSNWIVDYYKTKNVKYVISHDGKTFVILPIRKFKEYFDISAVYRVKKSGSSEPAMKDRVLLEQKIKMVYPISQFCYVDKKMFVNIGGKLIIDRFYQNNYVYYLAHRQENIYEIRRLSNTYNMNVIFSIILKKSQDSVDFQEFLNDI